MELELEPVDPAMGKGEDGAIDVGEDLAFQRRWWAFERVMWMCFAAVVVASLLGAFGHGWLAEASRTAAGGDLQVDYERVERANAPSIFTIRWSGTGEERLHVSDSLVGALGAARVIPAPERSILEDGITYVFPTSGTAKVELALEPRKPGVHAFTVTRANGASVEGRILVLP